MLLVQTYDIVYCSIYHLYCSQIADFVFKHLLPRTETLAHIIKNPSPSVNNLKPSQFSADHAL
jgi:hypothetical protein